MFAIVSGLLGGISWMVWHFFHAQLTHVLRWIRVAEMWAGSLIVSNDYTLAIPEMGSQSFKVWREWLPKADVANLGIPEIKVMSYLAVTPLKPVFAVVLALMALWVVLSGPGTQYRRRMNLEMLIKEQAKAFPVIAPFIKFNPRTMPHRAPGDPVPSKLPLFAEALSPEEWVAFHEIPYQGHRLDLNRTWQALALQLGKRWQGPSKLTPAAQALYAVFALKQARKRKESEELLNQLALCWTPERGLRLPLKIKSQIVKVIRDPKLGVALQKYADQHAYETTALLRCLHRAREEGGVLAPASFLWLRGQDRALWYPLNNLGRRSYHAEAVGALVHYTNEMIAGQKIPTPRFEDVVRGIETFLKGPGAKPIPPLNKKPADGKGKK
jgi:intracellular multiplication protein IcmP